MCRVDGLGHRRGEVLPADDRDHRPYGDAADEQGDAGEDQIRLGVPAGRPAWIQCSAAEATTAQLKVGVEPPNAPPPRGHVSQRFVNLAAEEVVALLRETVAPNLWKSVLARAGEILDSKGWTHGYSIQSRPRARMRELVNQARERALAWFALRASISSIVVA
ncbi:hypothetical protein SAMN04489832_5838 [Micromonospora cremea]|uniref:Uncharacterized protein n=1 Tax=Micromonospora cremea TaxID=709881 RepID=A0A1N6ANL6_9ACTN|nr:hypothetical protein SAMN04489832_5838 [Micromonospora cremea]